MAKTTATTMISVLSPDGMPIAPRRWRSQPAAEAALAAWMQRFTRQGYYATASGERIPLAALSRRCLVAGADGVEVRPPVPPPAAPAGYVAGQRYRVIKAGASVDGMKPIAPYAQQGYRLALQVGDILTCAGTSMTFGDGVPALKWKDADGQWICNDAIFMPTKGGMWDGQLPADGYLELVVEGGA